MVLSSISHTRQAPGSTEVRTDSVYVFILSDMVLLTAERDGKYMLISKDPIPVIYLGAVVDFRAEITLPERVRSTLCIEINEGDIGEADVEVSLHFSLLALLTRYALTEAASRSLSPWGALHGRGPQPDHGRDGPRRILPVTQKTFVRLLAPSQKQLQVATHARFTHPHSLIRNAQNVNVLNPTLTYSILTRALQYRCGFKRCEIHAADSCKQSLNCSGHRAMLRRSTMNTRSPCSFRLRPRPPTPWTLQRVQPMAAARQQVAAQSISPTMTVETGSPIGPSRSSRPRPVERQ
jgi:hypothetical protein